MALWVSAARTEALTVVGIVDLCRSQLLGQLELPAAVAFGAITFVVVYTTGYVAVVVAHWATVAVQVVVAVAVVVAAVAAAVVVVVVAAAVVAAAAVVVVVVVVVVVAAAVVVD